MDELSGLVSLLQGVSSPALVILAVFAWNLNKTVKELGDTMHDVDKRLALIERELQLEESAPALRARERRQLRR